MSNDLQQRKLFHHVEPQSIQSTYTQFTQTDFLISVGANRSLVRNSVRLVGDIKVLSAGSGDGGTRATGGILFNRNCGAHVFFDSMTTSFAGAGAGSSAGIIETINNYPRLVAMSAVAEKNELDMLNGSNSCELRGVNNLIMQKYANGITQTITTGTPITIDADFSIKPQVCLNRMDNDLPWNKTGIITLNCNLARNMDALFGAEQDVNSSYEIRNLRITYQSVPDAVIKTPTRMEIEHNVKSTILSGTATLSANVPAVCSGVSMNFIQTQHDSVQVFDSNRLENPTQLDKISFLINDKSNQLTTYNLTDQTEILERFVDSMYNSGRNQVSLDTFRANNTFCCGIDFDGGIDLSSNRFTFQIQSGINNAYPMAVNMYFHSAVAI